jgi:hypothetical protein
MELLLTKWHGEGAGALMPLRQVVKANLLDPLDEILRRDETDDKDVILVGATAGKDGGLVIDATTYEALNHEQQRRIVLAALNPFRQRVSEPRLERHGALSQQTHMTITEEAVNWVIEQAHHLKDDKGVDISDTILGGDALRRSVEQHIVKPLRKQMKDEPATTTAQEIVIGTKTDNGETKLEFATAGAAAPVGA